MCKRSAKDISSSDILSIMVESGCCQDKISCQGVLEFKDGSAKPIDLIKWVNIQINRAGVHQESVLSEDQAQ